MDIGNLAIFKSQQLNFYFYELIKNVLGGHYFSLVLFCISSWVEGLKQTSWPNPQAVRSLRKLSWNSLYCYSLLVPSLEKNRYIRPLFKVLGKYQKLFGVILTCTAENNALN